MRAVRTGVLIALLLGLTGIAQGRDRVALVNLENNPIVTLGGKELALDTIAQAIRTAGGSQGYPWTVSAESPGVLRLTTVVRGKHTVVVDVSFDTKAYSIRYVSSINMKYKDLTKTHGYEGIHPFYNTWVAELKQAIDAELRKL